MQGKIDALLEVQSKIKDLKEIELKIKNEIISSIPPLDEGTQSLKFETHGVSVSFKKTRTVNEKDLSKVWDILSDDVKSCIKNKPSLDTVNFRKFFDSNVEQFAKFLTEKDAAPTLTIKELK